MCPHCRTSGSNELVVSPRIVAIRSIAQADFANMYLVLLGHFIVHTKLEVNSQSIYKYLLFDSLNLLFHAFSLLVLLGSSQPIHINGVSLGQQTSRDPGGIPGMQVVLEPELAIRESTKEMISEPFGVSGAIP